MSSSFVPSAITRSFFELQTPDFAWKFVWTVDKSASQWFINHQQGGSNFTLRHFFNIIYSRKMLMIKDFKPCSWPYRIDFSMTE